ncbi:MAG: hypothetical protein ASARMPREDX12_008107 [Alectoria sarmentosa]|nr:MAG: hypothetical protein ASARMPREDX12_008107 [Alectoria sarmentosa]
MPPPTTTQKSTASRGDYEIDTRWTSIDAYTMSHLHPATRPNHAALARTRHRCDEESLPDIACPPPHGKFFALQCRMLNVTHALEVGTLGGYAAIWLATENPTLRVTTVEANPQHAAVARANVRAAGVADRVDVLLGAGLDVLPRLLDEIRAGERERFGFTFIDADKLNNYNYFDLAVRMSGPRACICVDNIVSKGKLAMEEEAAGNEMVRGARDCVERVGRDERVEGTVLQTVGEKDYDGFLMAVVK